VGRKSRRAGASSASVGIRSRRGLLVGVDRGADLSFPWRRAAISARCAAPPKAHPSVAVVLEGHTDNTREAAANKKLSLDRAGAVKDLLGVGGVAESRVNTAGFGSEKAISDLGA
jgi:hypothetical protein